MCQGLVSIPLVLYWRILQSLEPLMRKLRAYGIESHAIDDFKPDLANALKMSDYMYKLYVHAQKFMVTCIRDCTKYEM